MDDTSRTVLDAVTAIGVPVLSLLVGLYKWEETRKERQRQQDKVARLERFKVLEDFMEDTKRHGVRREDLSDALDRVETSMQNGFTLLQRQIGQMMGSRPDSSGPHPTPVRHRERSDKPE